MPVYLKQVHYPGFKPGRTGEVVYVIDDHTVFYSGITSSRSVASTVNLAEDVIVSIARAERRLWSHLDYVDIQTHRGYLTYAPGKCEVSRLHLRRPYGSLPVIDMFEPIKLETIPDRVRVLFMPYIDE